MPPAKRFKTKPEPQQLGLFDEHFTTGPRDIQMFNELAKQRYYKPPTLTNQLSDEERLRLARAH